VGIGISGTPKPLYALEEVVAISHPAARETFTACRTGQPSAGTYALARQPIRSAASRSTTETALSSLIVRQFFDRNFFASSLKRKYSGIPWRNGSGIVVSWHVGMPGWARSVLVDGPVWRVGHGWPGTCCYGAGLRLRVRFPGAGGVAAVEQQDPVGALLSC
jgi:hypothetical protein